MGWGGVTKRQDSRHVVPSMSHRFKSDSAFISRLWVTKLLSPLILNSVAGYILLKKESIFLMTKFWAFLILQSALSWSPDAGPGPFRLLPLWDASVTRFHLGSLPVTIYFNLTFECASFFASSLLNHACFTETNAAVTSWLAVACFLMVHFIINVLIAKMLQTLHVTMVVYSMVNNP